MIGRVSARLLSDSCDFAFTALPQTAIPDFQACVCNATAVEGAGPERMLLTSDEFDENGVGTLTNDLTDAEVRVFDDVAEHLGLYALDRLPGLFRAKET